MNNIWDVKRIRYIHAYTHISMYRMVVSDFAAATVLITMGALLGRVSHFQLIIVAFFEVMFYSANEALNIHVLKASDIGGSMLIHTFGAYFGISASLVLYNQKAKDHPRNSSVYHSDMFSIIGRFSFSRGNWDSDHMSVYCRLFFDVGS